MVHFLLKYLETFRDIGVLLCGGREIKYLETFRDIGAVLCGVGGDIKYHETFRDIGSERKEGVAWGGSQNVPRSVSCNFNAYIGTPISNFSLVRVYDFVPVTFPSTVYLEKSRDIWYSCRGRKKFPGL